MRMRTLIRLALTPGIAVWLSACGSSGDALDPPPGVTATASDGRVILTWNAEPGVEYWAFSASDPSLTSTNWLNLRNGLAVVDALPPLNVCGLVNGRQYWFTVNARTGSAGGGPGSPTISATPRPAGDTWAAGTPLGAPLSGLGYTVLTTCAFNPVRAPTGRFAAVGPAAAIFSSDDGKAWTQRAAPDGFTTNLNGVAGITGRINDTADPQLRFVAVGDGGAALYSTSTDVSIWSVGVAFDANQPALRAILGSGTSFIAVGDRGRIQTSGDGISWTVRDSGTAANLRGIAAGAGRLVAVGDAGAVVVSTDGGSTWTAQTIGGVGNLTAVAYGNFNNSEDNGGTLAINTFVAVGDAGVAAVGTFASDNTLNWSAQTVSAGTPLTGIAYITRFVATAADGSAFTSVRGAEWSGPIATGASGLTGIITDRYGYYAVGAGGDNLTSF